MSSAGPSPHFQHGGDPVELAMLRVAMDQALSMHAQLMQQLAQTNAVPGKGAHVNAYA